MARTAMDRLQSPEEKSSRVRRPTLATMIQPRVLPATCTPPAISFSGYRVQKRRAAEFVAKLSHKDTAQNTLWG